MGTRKTSKKFQLVPVYVVWDDAYSNDDWTSLEEVKGRTPSINASLGFLADEGKKHVTLLMTSELSDASDRVVATTLIIPKAYIITMETLIGNGRWKMVIDNTAEHEDEDTESTE